MAKLTTKRTGLSAAVIEKPVYTVYFTAQHQFICHFIVVKLIDKSYKLGD